MRERIHLALASDENYAKGLLVTACSLAERASREVELAFHILDGGVCEATWTHLTDAIRGLHPHALIDRIPIAALDSRLSSLPTYRGNTMTYARLALPAVLPDVDRCVYCDVDFLWLADVAELWHEMRESDLFCSVAEPCPATLDREAEWCRERQVPFRRDRYVCAGLSFYNLKRARETSLAERTIAFLDAHADAPFVDQTALNAVLDGDVHLVHEKWERLTVALKGLPPREDFVLHFAGDAPWRLSAPASVLTDAALLWHAYHARYAGITRLKSLRDCAPLPRLALKRAYWHAIRCPLLREVFFFALSLAGHTKCRSVMEAKCA